MEEFYFPIILIFQDKRKLHLYVLELIFQKITFNIPVTSSSKGLARHTPLSSLHFPPMPPPHSTSDQMDVVRLVPQGMNPVPPSVGATRGAGGRREEQEEEGLLPSDSHRSLVPSTRSMRQARESFGSSTWEENRINHMGW